jgi:hypothetical protein
MTWQIIRKVVQVQVGAARQYQVLRSPGGPRGLPAAQDIGWGPLTGGFGAGEIIDGPPLAHAATYVTARLRTRTGVSAPQVIRLLINDVQVATVALSPGCRQITAAIGPVTGAPGDAPSLAMPDPADPQLDDLTITLGSA